MHLHFKSVFLHSMMPFLRRSGRLIHAALNQAKGRFRSASLRFKIALFVVLLLTATSFILCITTVTIMNNYILNEITKRGESISKSIAASAGYNFLSKDILGMDNLVFKAQSSNNDVEYAAIVAPDGKVVVHSDLAMRGQTLRDDEGRWIRSGEEGTTVRDLTNSAGSIFEISCPIVFMNKVLGTVLIGINKSVFQEAQAQVYRRIVTVFGIVLVFGVVASTFLVSFLIKPIRELSAGVDELKQGISKKPLKIYSHDELGKLTANFNEMSKVIADQQGQMNRYTRDLEKAYISIVKVASAAIDARDSYTRGHSDRVSDFSLLIGRKIGLPGEELENLRVACLFHDIGKIKTPDSILLKPGKLTASEHKEMMRHPDYGVAILDKAPTLRKYIPAIRHHHERHDGKGYPDRLPGEHIPLLASIIAVADTFDAMTTDRPYRKALSHKEALQEIMRVAGTQLHPDLVEIFVGIMEKRVRDTVWFIGRTG